VTAAVRLRPFRPDDVDFLFDLAIDPVVLAGVVGTGRPPTREQHEAWFASKDDDRTLRLLVEDALGRPLGVTGLWGIDRRAGTAEVGIKLGGRPEARGRGHGTSAVHALTSLAFGQLGLRDLRAEVLSTNAASTALFERRCGWQRRGDRPQVALRDGRPVQVATFGTIMDRSQGHPGHPGHPGGEAALQ